MLMVQLEQEKIFRADKNILGFSLPSWTHESAVVVEGVDLTSATVTVVPVPVAPVAGVEGAGDGVLVALHHVVLGAPDVVPVVGIAVVVAVPGVVTRHVHEVGGGVTVAGHVAQVKLVGKVFVVQREL